MNERLLVALSCGGEFVAAPQIAAAILGRGRLPLVLPAALAAFRPDPRERTAASVRSSSRVLTRSRIIQRSISSRLKSRRFSPIL